MVTLYQPEFGHLVWIDCDPQTGVEQAGRRPALVISPAKFNIATGLVWACPVTNQVKGSPFEVRVPADMAVTGVIIVSQMKSFDWLAHRVSFIAVAPLPLTDEVVARATAILEG
jgi:mRNA interferase MazF